MTYRLAAAEHFGVVIELMGTQVYGVSMNSVQHRHGSDAQQLLDADCTYVIPQHGLSNTTWRLGPADLAFVVEGRSPTIVQLALFVASLIDPSRFVTALRDVLDHFECAAGERVGNFIHPGRGVRFSVMTLTEKELAARPPPSVLFDLPEGTSAMNLFTLRLANGDVSAGIGCCFDHSLCDVAGAALLLSHLSAKYACEVPRSVPHHEREQQMRMLGEPELLLEKRSMSGVSVGNTVHQKRGVRGGVVYIEWSYCIESLVELKTA